MSEKQNVTHTNKSPHRVANNQRPQPQNYQVTSLKNGMMPLSGLAQMPQISNTRPQRQATILHMQRQHGNAHVQRFLHQTRSTIQRETAPDGSQVEETPEQAAATAANAGEQTEWDALVEAKLEQFLQEFSNIPVQVSWEAEGQTQTATETVHPPYFMNATETAGAATKQRFNAAAANREAATGDAEKAPVDASWNALHGKSTPEEIQTILQTALDEGKIPTPEGKTHPDSTDLRDWLVKFGIGVDCSGFVVQALNEVMAELQGLSGATSDAPALSMGEKNAAALTGGQAGFRALTRPGDLRPGDTMGISGHIRVVMGVEQSEDGVTFTTAESRAGSKDGVSDIGVDRNVWRYGNADEFKGLQKQSGEKWSSSGETPTYGRYEALEQFEAENVPPTPEPTPVAGETPATEPGIVPEAAQPTDDAETWLAAVFAQGADALAGVVDLITSVPATLGDMVSEFGSFVTSFWEEEAVPEEMPAPKETLEPGAAALAAALAQGERDAYKLANVVFYARHPDRQNSPIDPATEPDAVKEWKAILDNEVKPALANPPAPAPAEETPAPTEPTTETPNAVTPEAEEEGSLFGILPDLQDIGNFLQEHVLFPVFGETPAEPETPITEPEQTPVLETPVETPVSESPKEEGSVLPPPPTHTKYTIKRSPATAKSEGFQETLNDISLKQSLLDKMYNMANYALENDLVTGDIYFTYGMRSPGVAHKWSTAWSIREDKIGLSKLQTLENSKGEKGKDEDGNTWYEEGWTMGQAKGNAERAWSGAQAAEGYPSGDQRKEPNNYSGVTRHATGLAIDAVFPWKDAGQVKDLEALEALKANIREKYKDNTAKRDKALAEVDRFVARGSYSELAEKTVAQFGLVRPLLHSTSTEDWHYEEP